MSVPPDSPPSANGPQVSGSASQTASPRRGRQNWHYVPPLPLGTSPYFGWPPDLPAIAKWLIRGWFPLTERSIILLFSVISWLLLPSLESTRTFAPDWISEIYLRNLFLMTLVAGGLHLYFYVWRVQGDERRYDARPFIRKNRVFTFASQVHDNIFWTLASGVTIWTAYEVTMLWALANGYLPSLSFSSDWPWLVLLILLLPMWETIHFFAIHRLIHEVPFYERIHALHHRNINVGPWSGLSMHPAEHLIYLSTVLIHFILPSHPLLIIFHLQYFTLSAATTHAGYQGITYRGKVILSLGTFHHQMHHRYFQCNYGGLEVPIDQWTGSFHDGTEESHQRFLEQRKKKIHG